MPMGPTDNTFVELLPKLITLLGQMKQAQGADLPWIITMENQVLAKQQQPVNDLRSSGQLPAPSQPFPPALQQQQGAPYPGAGAGGGGGGNPVQQLPGGGMAVPGPAPFSPSSELGRLLSRGARTS